LNSVLYDKFITV